MHLAELAPKTRLVVALLAALIALVLFGLLHASASTMADGALDPSFGNGGKVTTHFSRGPSTASAVVVQADGTILVAGSANNDFLVARYLSNGSLDHSFGSGGSVTTDFMHWDDAAKALAVQPDNRIVVAGTTSNSTANTTDIALARYLPDGQLDSSFGTGGLATSGLGSGGYLYASGVALQADGKIVIAGREVEGDCMHLCESYFMVARFDSDGNLDTSFGGTGIILTYFPGSRGYDDLATSLIVQPDGKIIAAGQASGPGPGILGDFALARYLPDGSRDPSFGISGTVMTDFAQNYDIVQALALQPDGKIVAAGRADDFECPTPNNCYEYWHFGIARYLGYGQLDASFGVSGTTTVTFARYDVANSVSLQPDGKLVIAGLQSTTPYDGDAFALARLLPTGEADPSFGNSGKVVTTFGNSAAINAAALQPDNKIVAVGMGQGTLGTTDVALARYLNALSPTPTPTPQPPPCPGERFTDVCPGDYFYTATLALANDGILSGYSTSPPCLNSEWIPCFNPYANITRGQIAKVASLAAGFHEPVSGQIFRDVPPGSTFYEYVQRMATRGIMQGYAGFPWCPEDPPPLNMPCFFPNRVNTRGQLSKVIALTFGFSEPVSGQTFQDVPPDSTFYDYVQRLAGRGLINGYPCGGAGEPCVPPDNLPYFRPNNNVTRGQTAKIVQLARTQPAPTPTLTTTPDLTSIPTLTATPVSTAPPTTTETAPPDLTATPTLTATLNTR